MVERGGKLMLTPFGKFCRKLRIDKGELLKEMADKLGVTSSYLSAVENGRRNIPKDWAGKIASIYHLSEDQFNDLQSSIEESQSIIKVDLSGANAEQKNLMLAFAREFKDLSDETTTKIKNILLKSKNNGDGAK